MDSMIEDEPKEGGVKFEPKGKGRFPSFLAENQENSVSSSIPNEFHKDHGNAETNPWSPSKHYVLIFELIS